MMEMGHVSGQEGVTSEFDGLLHQKQSSSAAQRKVYLVYVVRHLDELQLLEPQLCDLAVNR